MRQASETHLICARSVSCSLGRMFQVRGYEVERFAYPRLMLEREPWTQPIVLISAHGGEHSRATAWQGRE